MTRARRAMMFAQLAEVAQRDAEAEPNWQLAQPLHDLADAWMDRAFGLGFDGDAFGEGSKAA